MDLDNLPLSVITGNKNMKACIKLIQRSVLIFPQFYLPSMHTAKEKRKINLIVYYLPGNSWTCCGDELAVEHMGEWPMTWIGVGMGVTSKSY